MRQCTTDLDVLRLQFNYYFSFSLVSELKTEELLVYNVLDLNPMGQHSGTQVVSQDS